LHIGARIAVRKTLFTNKKKIANKEFELSTVWKVALYAAET